MEINLYNPEELSQKVGISYNPDEFQFFNLKGKVLRSGEYAFSMLSDNFTTGIQACSVVGGEHLQVTVFPNSVKFAAFHAQAFVEKFLPAVLVTPWQEYYVFLLPLKKLQKLSSHLGSGETLTFQYSPQKTFLQITCESSTLEFSTPSPQYFIDYHQKLDKLTPAGDFPAHLLREGLQFVSKFSVHDKIEHRLNLAEVKEGLVLAGGRFSIGMYQNSALNKIRFGIKDSLISTTEKILGLFDEQQIFVFNSPSFILLRNEDTYFGIEKYNFTFPNVQSFLNVNSGEKSFVCCKLSLLKALYKLEVFADEKNCILQLKIIPEGEQGTLHLTLQDMSGKVAKDCISVSKHTLGIQEQNFQVNIKELIKILDLYSGGDVEFFESYGKALLIFDQQESCNTLSVLSFLNDTKITKSGSSSSISKNSVSGFINQHILKGNQK